MCLSRPGRLTGNEPKTEAERHAANEPYRRWRFPTHYAIENLTRDVSALRDRASDLQRRGLPQEALALRCAAATLSGEIERLTNSLGEPV